MHLKLHLTRTVGIGTHENHNDHFNIQYVSDATYKTNAFRT